MLFGCLLTTIGRSRRTQSQAAHLNLYKALTSPEHALNQSAAGRISSLTVCHTFATMRTSSLKVHAACAAKESVIAAVVRLHLPFKTVTIDVQDTNILVENESKFGDLLDV